MSEYTHQVRPLSKINACIDTSSSRYALANVQIMPAPGENRVFCAATDGCVLSLAVAEGHAASPALLPGKLVKCSGRKPPAAKLNGQWECGDKFAPAVTECRFPRVEDTLPQIESDSIVVRLDANRLHKLAEAIGSEGRVTLFIPRNIEERKAFCPIAVDGEHGIGVIMPCAAERPAAESHYEELRNEYSESAKAAKGGGK